MKVIPREVKKTKVITNSSDIRKLRDNITLSKYQKEILVGTLLGDSCLIPNIWGKNYRLQVSHSRTQKELVDWKYKIFKNFTLSSPKYDKIINAWKFRTISHPEFTDLYKGFYRNKKKIVPKDIVKVITPVGLAVWFMDDGSIGPRKQGYILNSQCFSLEENLKLKYCLEKKFGITEVSIHKDKKFHRLYIKLSSMKKFFVTVSPHIIPSMKYKLS